MVLYYLCVGGQKLEQAFDNPALRRFALRGSVYEHRGQRIFEGGDEFWLVYIPLQHTPYLAYADDLVPLSQAAEFFGGDDDRNP